MNELSTENKKKMKLFLQKYDSFSKIEIFILQSIIFNNIYDTPLHCFYSSFHTHFSQQSLKNINYIFIK
jgi:hypothetical protein